MHLSRSMKQAAAVLGVLTAITVLVAVAFAPRLYRSYVIGYVPSQVLPQNVQKIRFYCPATGRSLVLRDPERIAAAASIYQQLTMETPSPTAGEAWDESVETPHGSVYLSSTVRFRDGGFLSGVWTLGVRRSYAGFIPGGTLDDIDPGPYYLPPGPRPHESEGDRRAMQSFVQELIELGLPAVDEPHKPRA